MAAAAADSGDPQRQDALADLCQAYWPPLYAFLRRRGHTPENAQDLTQGFFARVLERQDFRAADPPEAGSDRSCSPHFSITSSTSTSEP